MKRHIILGLNTKPREGGHSPPSERKEIRVDRTDGSSREEDMDPRVWPTAFLLCALGTWSSGSRGKRCVSRSAAFPGPWERAAPGLPLTELPGQGTEPRRPPRLHFSSCGKGPPRPSNSRNRWPKRLAGVEVVWSAEVVREFGVRAAPIQGTLQSWLPRKGPLSGPCSGPLLCFRAAPLSDIGPM